MIIYTPAQQEFMEKLKEMGLNYDDSRNSFGYRLTDNLHLGVFLFNFFLILPFQVLSFVVNISNLIIYI